MVDAKIIVIILLVLLLIALGVISFVPFGNKKLLCPTATTCPAATICPTFTTCPAGTTCPAARSYPAATPYPVGDLLGLRITPQSNPAANDILSIFQNNIDEGLMQNFKCQSLSINHIPSDTVMNCLDLQSNIINMIMGYSMFLNSGSGINLSQVDPRLKKIAKEIAVRLCKADGTVDVVEFNKTTDALANSFCYHDRGIPYNPTPGVVYQTAG
jgi:hypothetical protein